MTPEEIRSQIALVQRSSRQTAIALVCVAVLALVFTMVNVTLFAIGEQVPGAIAWLLDPMASVALGSMILAEGTLARFGCNSGPWANAVKWYAGLATWAMNIWSSAAAHSAAGVLLHSVAPGIVLGLAAAAPVVRRQFAAVVSDLEQELRDIDDERARQQAMEIAREQAERERIHRERQVLAEVESKERVAKIEQERLERQTLELARIQLEHQERIQADAAVTTALTPASDSKPRDSSRPVERREVDLDRLIEQARPLVAQGLGRAAIQAKLKTTEHWARKAIEGARKDRTPLRAVSR